MIGVLGGTFDPIHFGHLRPALEVLLALGLDELRFVPVGQAVHREPPHAAAAHRLAMVEAAVRGQPGFIADRRELDRPGRSYTFDTLTSLREEFGPRRPLCLLLGSDAFRGFLSWHRPLEILGLAHLVVMTRPGSETAGEAPLQNLQRERSAPHPRALRASPAGRIYFLEVTQLEISATAIRELVAAGQSPRFLLPDPVISVIAREGLYRPDESHTASRGAAPST